MENEFILHEPDVEAYLTERFKTPVKLCEMVNLGISGGETMKGFGYGNAVLLVYELNRKRKQAVLVSMRKDKYGHQHSWDRAHSLLFQYRTANRLPRHAKVLDAGYLTADSRLKSIHDSVEFFILEEKVEGRDYFLDLRRIKESGATKLDVNRSSALANYLAQIHNLKHGEPDLYIRKIRELVGESECIMGIIDGYPLPNDFIDLGTLKAIEKLCVDWRWRLKKFTHRLCQEHGDFHPWNIKFREGTDFSVYDRSRGEFGEAADDVSTLSINYLLYSLSQTGKLAGDFLLLHQTFWETYLNQTKDTEILQVISPFYAFRGLVIASPEWYPRHPTHVRRALLNFVENVLATDAFDYRDVNQYLD